MSGASRSIHFFQLIYARTISKGFEPFFWLVQFKFFCDVGLAERESLICLSAVPCHLESCSRNDICLHRDNFKVVVGI